MSYLQGFPCAFGLRAMMRMRMRVRMMLFQPVWRAHVAAFRSRKELPLDAAPSNPLTGDRNAKWTRVQEPFLADEDRLSPVKMRNICGSYAVVP